MHVLCISARRCGVVTVAVRTRVHQSESLEAAASALRSEQQLLAADIDRLQLEVQRLTQDLRTAGVCT
jgi:hypothetical protein